MDVVISKYFETEEELEGALRKAGEAPQYVAAAQRGADEAAASATRAADTAAAIVTEEDARQRAETARMSAEADREDAEAARDAGETARIDAEGRRSSAEQGRVNAEAARAVHLADKANPHRVTAAQAGADQAGAAQAVQGNLQTHMGDKRNPHGVTAAQTGALPLTGGTLDGNLKLDVLDANAANAMFVRASTYVEVGDDQSGAVMLGGDSDAPSVIRFGHPINNMEVPTVLRHVAGPIQKMDAANKAYVDAAAPPWLSDVLLAPFDVKISDGTVVHNGSAIITRRTCFNPVMRARYTQYRLYSLSVVIDYAGSAISSIEIDMSPWHPQFVGGSSWTSLFVTSFNNIERGHESAVLSHADVHPNFIDGKLVLDVTQQFSTDLILSGVIGWDEP